MSKKLSSLQQLQVFFNATLALELPNRHHQKVYLLTLSISSMSSIVEQLRHFDTTTLVSARLGQNNPQSKKFQPKMERHSSSSSTSSSTSSSFVAPPSQLRKMLPSLPLPNRNIPASGLICTRLEMCDGLKLITKLIKNFLAHYSVQD